jgi:hypothetical protein
MRIEIGGSEPTPLGVGGGQLAVDATNVYWTTGVPGGAVVAMPLAGGLPFTLALADGEGIPFDITVADGEVFWAECGTDRVGRVLRYGP